MDAVQTEIWEWVQQLNRCWTFGNADDLKDFFHERMVAITPSDRGRIAGSTECIAAWKEFAEKTRTDFWKELDPDIQVYGTAAVVTYYYRMSGEMKGEPFEVSGRDMMTLIQENDRWWLVADQFSPYPAKQ